MYGGSSNLSFVRLAIDVPLCQHARYPFNTALDLSVGVLLFSSSFEMHYCSPSLYFVCFRQPARLNPSSLHSAPEHLWLLQFTEQ